MLSHTLHMEAPADATARRAREEGEARTRAYELTLDPRQRPAWTEEVPMAKQ